MDPISRQISAVAAGVGGEKYWINETTSFSNTETLGLATDSAKNVFHGFTQPLSSPKNFYLAKYDSKGSVQWVRRITATTLLIQKVLLDSSGNIYLLGNTNSTSVYEIVWIKLNSNGENVSSFRFDQPGGDTYQFGDAFYDPGTNTIFVATRSGILLQIDSSGNGTPRGRINLFNNTSPVYVALDNVFSKFVFAGTTSTGLPAIGLVPFNFGSSVGRVYSSAFSGVGTGIAVSGGALFLTGYFGAISKAILVKASTFNGDLSWAREISSSSEGTGAALQDGIIYGYRGFPEFYAAKFNPEGDILWSRLLGTGNSEFLSRLIVDNDKSYYFGGRDGNADQAIVSKLPSDGTRTGTFGSYSYSSTSVTVTTANTWSTASSGALNTATPNRSSITVANSAVSINITTIPV